MTWDLENGVTTVVSAATVVDGLRSGSEFLISGFLRLWVLELLLLMFVIGKLVEATELVPPLCLSDSPPRFPPTQPLKGKLFVVFNFDDWKNTWALN